MVGEPQCQSRCEQKMVDNEEEKPEAGCSEPQGNRSGEWKTTVCWNIEKLLSRAGCHPLGSSGTGLSFSADLCL